MANRTVSVGMKLVLSQWSPNAERAAKDVDKVTAAVGKVGDKSKSWDKVGKASAVAAAGGALALKKLTGVTMDFDRAMSGVGAVANASAGDLGRLREAALQAGADTAFSASQAATAEAELAKAGVSTADILGGALTGSLNLAAAGQLDLGEAATISAQAMNIWKLSGKDVSHIADVLAAGANKSAADVGQLGDAMRQGGLVAAQMGVGMEDTVAVLAAFADNALVGSDAGTSLKTMLQKLMAPSKEAAAVMDDVGLQAFDASGQFVGMETLAGQLQDRLGSLTQQQRSAALATIFGSDAIRAANVLYEIGAGGVGDYTNAVDDQGAAARMAGTQMNNLAGDLEQLRGSVETVLVKQGSGATAVLRGMAHGATDFVNVIGEMPAPLAATGTGLLAVATAGAGALFMFGSVAPRVRAARLELAAMGPVGEKANVAVGKVGKGLAVAAGAAAGIELLSFGVGQLQDALADTVPGVNELTASLLKAREWGDISKALGDDVEDLGVKIRQIVDPSTTQSINKVFAGVIGKAPKTLREARDEVGGLDQALTGLVQAGHGDEAARQFNLIAQAASAGGASVDQVREALPGYREALAGVGNETTLAGDKTKGLGAALTEAGGKAGDAVQATDELGRATKLFTGTAVDASGELHEYASAAEILTAKLTLLSGVSLDLTETDIAFHGALADVREALHDNGRTTDINTTKGRDNVTSVIAAIKAAREHAAAVTDQTAATHSNAFAVSVGEQAFRKQTGALWPLAQRLGITRAQFDELTGAVRRVPPKAKTDVTAPGATTARQKMNDVTKAANDIPDAVSTRVTASDAASATISRVSRELASLDGRTATTYVRSISIGSGALVMRGQQTGGKVGGTGTGDTQPRMLDPREWVIRPEAAAHYGDAFLAAVNNRTLRLSGPAPGHPAPGPAAGPVVHITVNAPAGMDVRTLAAEVSRRIGAQAGLLSRAR